MSKPEIWFADLTHTAQGISAATFPLGVSFVVSYAKQQFGNDIDISLFRLEEFYHSGSIRRHRPN